MSSNKLDVFNENVQFLMGEDELSFDLETYDALIVYLVNFFDDLLVALVCCGTDCGEYFFILMELPVFALGNWV